jgi:signal transduction histidine kinase
VRVIHRFARELRPAMLDDLGLIPTLRVYIEDFPKRRGRRILFSAFAGAEALDNDKRTVLYRVAQEALINAAKHAQARLIKVSLRSVPGGVCLEIADNGRSFDVGRLTSARWNKRLGLIGMRERVEMVGGRFNIVSAPGTGTTIRAEIPFAETIVGAVMAERIVGAAG